MRQMFSHNIKVFSFVLLFIAVFLYSPFLKTPLALATESSGTYIPVDNAGNVKDVGITIFGIPTGLSLDSIAFTIVNEMLSQMTNSIVNWINSGFNGSPSFVTDPGQFFLDTGDRAAGTLIEEMSANGVGAGCTMDPDTHHIQLDPVTGQIPAGCIPLNQLLCSPFTGIKLAITLNYSKRFQKDIKCKLSDVVNNVENYGKFVNGDFGGQGGWDTWFSVTQNQQNNPYGVYVASSIELDKRVAAAIGTQQTQLNWGSGFLSSQDCIESDPTTHACRKYGPIKTPGSVIESQLNTALGTGQHRLEVADELNEIMGALLQQLVQTVLTQGLSASGSLHGGGIVDPNAQTPALDGTCSANAQNAQTGITLVAWSVLVQGGPTGEASYTWYGDEIPAASSAGFTRTDNPYKVVYTIPGTKTARVVVKKGGAEKTITCSNSVNVSNYAPLAVSCSITPASVPRDEAVLISTRITGGSGNGACAYNGWVDNDQIQIIKSPFNDDGHGGPGCHASTVQYSQDPGQVQVNVTVNDAVAGQSVTMQCGTVITTP